MRLHLIHSALLSEARVQVFRGILLKARAHLPTHTRTPCHHVQACDTAAGCCGHCGNLRGLAAPRRAALIGILLMDRCLHMHRCFGDGCKPLRMRALSRSCLALDGDGRIRIQSCPRDGANDMLRSARSATAQGVTGVRSQKARRSPPAYHCSQQQRN